MYTCELLAGQSSQNSHASSRYTRKLSFDKPFEASLPSLRGQHAELVSCIAAKMSNAFNASIESAAAKVSRFRVSPSATAWACPTQYRAGNPSTLMNDRSFCLASHIAEPSIECITIGWSPCLTSARRMVYRLGSRVYNIGPAFSQASPREQALIDAVQVATVGLCLFTAHMDFRCKCLTDNNGSRMSPLAEALTLRLLSNNSPRHPPPNIKYSQYAIIYDMENM